jgi:thiol-disulfide isomerase/thioredoxin
MKQFIQELIYFNGKLMILDFWATWCGACISKFPKLDSLQKKYADKL